MMLTGRVCQSSCNMVFKSWAAFLPPRWRSFRSSFISECSRLIAHAAIDYWDIELHPATFWSWKYAYTSNCAKVHPRSWVKYLKSVFGWPGVSSSCQVYWRFLQLLWYNQRKSQFNSHDPHQIFNVDEVGVQLAERSINLITGCEYLNKNMVQTSIHVTLVLCTSPGQGGVYLLPHFLFQNADLSDQNLFCRTVNCTGDYNSTGYQDDHTWSCWMSLFIIWKNHWLQTNGFGPKDLVLLLLDGHYSHLNHEVLFTATMNHMVIVCMLAHVTHLVQPNDKSVNKRFKQNLDEELAKMASNALAVQNYDIACLCEKALECSNMKGAIISSYQQVFHPYVW